MTEVVVGIGGNGGSSSNDVVGVAIVVARMKKALRKKVERGERSGGRGWKGKGVRRGLGGKRRISPLQRILSALHLFQDVVFSLRRESHTLTPSPLESLVSSFPAPSLVASAPPVPRCPPRFPSFSVIPRSKSHLFMRFGDDKLEIFLTIEFFI